MPSRYERQDHIQRLEVGLRAEDILDQREVTIQEPQTTVPFDCDGLDAGLEGPWITPQIRFGVLLPATSDCVTNEPAQSPEPSPDAARDQLHYPAVPPAHSGQGAR
jgi:hypothetical protein